MSNKKYLYFIIESFILIILMVFYATHSMLLPDPSKPYSTEIFHRLQTNALLQGKIFLSPKPFGFIQDFNWSDHGMSQNWGLGVALLILPFEWIAQQCGFAPFPDCLILLFYLALMIILLNVSLKLLLMPFGLTAYSPMGLLVRWYFITWILFCPAISGLIRCHYYVFEKTIFYGCIYSFTLLSLFWIYLRRSSDRVFLVLCLVSGLACLVRPTLIFYGLTTTMLAMIHAYQDKRNTRLIVIGAILFCLGVGVDLTLNYYRFGSIFEFGYSTSISGNPRLDYALRFDYPFRREPVLIAAKELIGSLFFNYLWQSDTYHFLEWTFDAFNASHLIFLAFGGIFYIFLVLSGLLRRKFVLWNMDTVCSRTIFFSLSWGIISFGSLFIFYLHCPALASRYLTEFAAAICVIVITLILPCIYWTFSYCNERQNKIVLVLFLIALGLFYYFSNWSFFKFDYPSFKKKGYGIFVTDKKGLQDLLASFNQSILLNRHLPDSFNCGQSSSFTGLSAQFSGWDISKSCSVVGATSIFLPTERCITLNYSFLNLNHPPSIRVKRNFEFLRSYESRIVKTDPVNSHQEQITQVFCSDKLPVNPIALYSIGWGTPDQLRGQLSVMLNWVSVADRNHLPSMIGNKNLPDNVLWHRWDFLPTDRPVLINLTDDNVLDFHEGHILYQQGMEQYGPYWKNDDQIFFNPYKQGAEIGFLLRFAKIFTGKLAITFTTAPDAGIIEVLLNNIPLTTVPIDLYSKDIYIKTADLEDVPFQKGNNILTIKVIGHNDQSLSMCLGVDTIEIR